MAVVPRQTYFIWINGNSCISESDIRALEAEAILTNTFGPFG